MEFKISAKKVMDEVQRRLQMYPTGCDINFPRYFMKEIVQLLRENLGNTAAFIVIDPEDSHHTFTISVARTQEALDKRESMR